jgi:predicted MFS family arabinose efflux permease
LSGFSFSSWAARIPTIKTTFEMNEAELGNFLFILPVCSLVGLPLSAWFIAKYESRYLLLSGFFISGLGVVSIFPMSFKLAGYSKKYAPGVAISIVGTYPTVGVLLAPPFVGYVAHLFSLNLAFLIFIVAALLLIIFSRKAYTFL